MRTHLSLLLLVSACTEEPFNGNGDELETVDAAIHGDDEDASTSEPDASTSEALDSGTEPTEHDAAPPPTPRCTGGDYETAPSGAACDPTRIMGAGLLGDCYGPQKGEYCDSLAIELPFGAAVPDGVECMQSGSAPPSCHYVGEDASNPPRTLDDATLEALCAMTASNPDLVVRCWVFE